MNMNMNNKKKKNAENGIEFVNKRQKDQTSIILEWIPEEIIIKIWETFETYAELCVHVSRICKMWNVLAKDSDLKNFYANKEHKEKHENWWRFCNTESLLGDLSESQKEMHVAHRLSLIYPPSINLFYFPRRSGKTSFICDMIIRMLLILPKCTIYCFCLNEYALLPRILEWLSNESLILKFTTQKIIIYHDAENTSLEVNGNRLLINPPLEIPSSCLPDAITTNTFFFFDEFHHIREELLTVPFSIVKDPNIFGVTTSNNARLGEDSHVSIDCTNENSYLVEYLTELTRRPELDIVD